METANSFRPISVRRPNKGVRIATDGKMLAFGYSFAVGMILLLNGVLQSLSAFAILGLGVLSPIVFARQILRNRNVAVIYFFPLLSLLSALWSNHPDNTIYYTVQLLLTLNVAAALASLEESSAALWGLFWAHLLFAMASLVLGQTVAWEGGETVFVGLSVAKNAYGLVNLFVILLGVYATHDGIGNGRRTSLLLGLASIAVGFVGLILSKSSGALAVSFVGVFVYLLLQAISSIAPTFRVIVLVIFLILLAMTLAILVPLWTQITDAILAFFGKSSDLTGRVELWFIADRLIEKHFWLGIGQFGFWVQGDPLPEAIWQEFGIQGRRGFNFHNTYREVMVHLGAIGLGSYLTVILFMTFRQIKAAIFSHSRERFFYVAILFTMFWRAPFETILPLQPVYSPAIFLAAALALRRPERRAA